MNTCKKIAKYACHIVLLLLGILALLITIALTPLGLKGLAAAAQVLTHHRLTISQIQGGLLRHVNADEVRWQGTNETVAIKQVSIQINPTALLKKQIHIDDLQAASISISSKEQSHQHVPYSTATILNKLPKSLPWPAWLSIQKMQIQQIVMHRNHKDYTFADAILKPNNSAYHSSYYLTVLQQGMQQTHYQLLLTPVATAINLHFTASNPAIRINVHGKLNQQLLHITDFSIHKKHGSITGTFYYHFGKHPAASIKSYFHQFVLTSQQISGYFSLQLNLQDAINISGNMHTPANHDYIHFTIHHLQHWQAKWDSNITQIHYFIPQLQGWLKSQGSYEQHQITGSGQLQINALSLSSIKLNRIQASWNSAQQTTGHVSAQLLIQRMHYRNKQIKHLQMRFTGTASKHTLSVTAILPHNYTWQTILTGHAALHLRQWHSTIQTFTISKKQHQLWHLAIPALLNWQNNTIELQRFQLVNHDNLVSINGNYNLFAPWKISATINSATNALLNNYPVLQNSHLTSDDAIAGNGKQITSLFSDNKFKTHLKNDDQPWSITNLLQYKQHHITNQLSAYHAATKVVNFNLSNDNINNLRSAFAVTSQWHGKAHIHLSSDTLSKLTAPFTAFKAATALNFDANISGSYASPSITATASIPGYIYTDYFNKKFSQSNIDIDTKNHTIYTALTTHIDQSPLTINGMIQPNKQYQSNWHLKHQAFQLFNYIQKNIYITPDVRMNCQGIQCTISGTVSIPKATYHIQKTYSSTTLPMDDITFVHGENDQGSWAPNMNQLLIRFGKHVNVSGYGAFGSVDGEISINKTALTPYLLNGSIHLNNAYINIQQNKLKLTNTKFSYIKSPANNPHLQISAQKNIHIYAGPRSAQQSGIITVGITISGTVKHPIVNLYSSSNTMSQADILSYLIFGQPAGSASLLNTTTLFSLTSNSLGDSKLNLIDKFKSTLGLSEFGVEADNSFNAAGNVGSNVNQFVIGKNLFHKFYLRYSIPLERKVNGLNYFNTLMLIYQLNKYWSIQSSKELSGIYRYSAIDLMLQFAR